MVDIFLNRSDSSCGAVLYERKLVVLPFAMLTLVLAILLGLSACTAQSSKEDVVEEVSTSAESASHYALRHYDTRLDGLRIDGKTPYLTTKASLWALQPGYSFEVKEELQYPELPSGCEIVSLIIALRSMGFPLEKTELADEYLEIDGELDGYLDSPYGDGGGCFPLGMVKLANTYLKAKDSLSRGHDLTGSSFESLEALADAGYPVLIWATLYLDDPWFEEGYYWYSDGYEDYDYYSGAEGSQASSSSDASEGDWRTEELERGWYYDEHCVVMYGTKFGKVLIADPMEGLYELDADAVASVYKRCGSMAMVVY